MKLFKEKCLKNYNKQPYLVLIVIKCNILIKSIIIINLRYLFKINFIKPKNSERKRYLVMHKLLHIFPVGLLSTGLIAVKTSQYSNAFRKPLLKTSLALPMLALMKPRVQMKAQILRKLEEEKPRGIVKFIIYGIRFIQLGLIFLPSILLLPLAIFKATRIYWLNCFVWSISKAGVVWIKVFQHMSHRADVIGYELAQSCQSLRSFSPQHSYKQTIQIFQKVYKQSPQVFFDYINPKPIASGSISQVYEAIFRGQKVAVKVRHPNIEKNIEKDLSIVFAVSRFMANFSLFFEIPIDQDSFRQKLIQQLDFLQQKRNLQKFNRVFTNPQVTFPQPFDQSSQQVLIMTFLPGQIMTDFQKHYNKKVRSYVAKVGASIFFQMLFQHNFTHVDCHGGNIMVKINKQYSIWTELRDYFRIAKSFVWINVVKLFLNTKYLKNLASQFNREQIRLRTQLMKQRATAQVSLLDVGMVITLQPEKRISFLNILSEVIQGNPKKCAQMIYNISKYRGQPLKEGQFPLYVKDLEQMFRMVEGIDIKDVDGLKMLKGMLEVIRKHKMKLDGQFAALLTNMLALQGIAKKLDPQINILRCAVPYLPYKNNPLPP